MGEASSAVSITDTEDRLWRHRFLVVVRGIEEMTGQSVPNPEDVACNLQCNHCGKIAVAWLHVRPTGWEIGALGESDYCPDCR